MSTELTRPDFLSPEIIKAELDEQAGLVNPATLFPRMRLNKDIKGFMINMGDQVIGTPSEVNFLILGAENFYGSRALFAPGDESTSPVCATSLESPANERQWLGRWDDTSGYPKPAEGELRCGTCPWGQFGSDPQWDDSKTGKGPACKQRRVIYGVQVEETTQQGRFSLVDDTVIKLVLPATSIGTTKAMGSKATAAKWPLSASCFQLTAKQESRGSIKWCTLQAELVGVIGDESSYRRIQELRAKVSGVVNGTPEPETTHYNETSATKAEGEDEIPF